MNFFIILGKICLPKLSKKNPVRARRAAAHAQTQTEAATAGWLAAWQLAPVLR